MSDDRELVMLNNSILKLRESFMPNLDCYEYDTEPKKTKTKLFVLMFAHYVITKAWICKSGKCTDKASKGYNKETIQKNIASIGKSIGLKPTDCTIG